MQQLTAAILIELKDRVSGVAEKIADRFEKIKKAVRNIPVNALKSLRNVLGDILRVLAGMVGFYGFRALGRSLAELVRQVGPIQSVRQAFQAFVEQARASVPEFTRTADGLLREMQRLTYGALSTTEMLRYANLAFLLIGEQVANQLPQLLQIAQAASLATGETMEYMFESLIKGIGRLSQRWLDNLGITISLDEAYSRYAETLGISARQLTDNQRRLAVLNAAIEEGQNIILSMGDASMLLSTQQAALGMQFVNLRDEILNDLAPAFTVVMAHINEMLSQALPRVQDWVQGFMDAIAQLPPSLEGEAAEMGHRAGQWAINAASWGANIGASFAIGILEGFTAAITFVLDTIAGILSSWFAPGSPPRIAPQIDVWGEATMAEWVNGLLAGAEDIDLTAMAQQLGEQLEAQVQPQFFQWGADAIASWAEGLSTIDLEFLSERVEASLNRARDAQEGLTDKLKEQKRELFRLQILGRDPASIRNKLREVQSTQAALDAQEREVEMLEDRRALIREQLSLFRLLTRALRDMQQAGRGGGGGGGGGGAAVPDLAEQFAQRMPLSTANLADRLKGIAATLSEVFSGPLEQIQTAWTNATTEISTSWQNVLDTLDGVWSRLGGISGIFDGLRGTAESLAAAFPSWDEGIQGFLANLDLGTWDEWASILRNIRDIFLPIARLIGTIAAYLIDKLGAALPGVGRMWTGLVTVIRETLEIATGLVAGAVHVIEMLLTGATWDEIVAFLSEWGNDIIGDAEQWLGGFYDLIVGQLEAMAGFWGEILDDILALLANINPRFQQAGEDLVNGLQEGIRSAWDRFIAWASERAAELSGIFRLTLQAFSPSRVFRAIGEDVVAGFGQGLDFTRVLSRAQGQLGGFAMGAAGATGGGGGVVVNINAPLMENVMVPNMQVGRALSQQIAQDIGQMAFSRRLPS